MELNFSSIRVFGRRGGGVVWRRPQAVGLIVSYIKFVEQNQIENNEFQENSIHGDVYFAGILTFYFKL